MGLGLTEQPIRQLCEGLGWVSSEHALLAGASYSPSKAFNERVTGNTLQPSLSRLLTTTLGDSGLSASPLSETSPAELSRGRTK
jgi:hypothetical protein